MKTIAVMTMAFLPGTFFAALFAVPSLKWEQPGPNVIQPKFWVYWAFTLPSTLLVFVVWTALNYKTWIWAQLKARQKGMKGKEKEDASASSGIALVDVSLLNRYSGIAGPDIP